MQGRAMFLHGASLEAAAQEPGSAASMLEGITRGIQHRVSGGILARPAHSAALGRESVSFGGWAVGAGGPSSSSHRQGASPSVPSLPPEAALAVESDPALEHVRALRCEDMYRLDFRFLVDSSKVDASYLKVYLLSSHFPLQKLRKDMPGVHRSLTGLAGRR